MTLLDAQLLDRNWTRETQPRSERFASFRPKKVGSYSPVQSFNNLLPFALQMIEHYNPDPDILSAMENRGLKNLFRLNLMMIVTTNNCLSIFIRTSGLLEFISLYAIVSLPMGTRHSKLLTSPSPEFQVKVHSPDSKLGWFVYYDHNLIPNFELTGLSLSTASLV